MWSAPSTIDQLAHVQEETNGLELKRSTVLALRENGDHQRATGPVYRASFITGGYRRLTPSFLPVSIYCKSGPKVIQSTI
jgi:hypothetical protein